MLSGLFRNRGRRAQKVLEIASFGSDAYPSTHVLRGSLGIVVIIVSGALLKEQKTITSFEYVPDANKRHVCFLYATGFEMEICQ